MAGNFVYVCKTSLFLKWAKNYFFGTTETRPLG